MTDRGSIAGKISSLLAMADPENGATEAECALFAAKAQALMLKHRIGAGELHGVQRRSLPGVTDTMVGEYPIGQYWIAELLIAVGHPVGVDCYVFNLSSARRRFQLVGRPDTTAYVRIVTDWIVPQLVRHCEVALSHRKQIAADEWSTWAPGDTIRFRRSFYTAAVYRIGQRLKQSIEGEPGTDLVTSDRRAVKDYYDDAGLRLCSTSVTRQFDADATVRGHRAANQVDIDPRNKVSHGSDRPELPA